MTKDDMPDPTRRRLLTRLGLAASVAYVAPTMLQLTPAHASGKSRPSYSRPSRRDRHRGRDAYEQGYRDGRRDSYQRDRYYDRDRRYRESLTREERAVEYLLETLTTR